jgi:hypothetical protein
MTRIVPLLLCAVTLGLGGAPARVAAEPPAGKVDYPTLPKPGEKVPLGADHYFTYGFAAQPKLGTAILRVEIFTRDGARDTSFVVKGDADMPSMRGAHATGDKEFSVSKKNVYLLPIQLVMPGDWEVRLTFLKSGAAVLRGAYLFDL